MKSFTSLSVSMPLGTRAMASSTMLLALPPFELPSAAPSPSPSLSLSSPNSTSSTMVPDAFFNSRKISLFMDPGGLPITRNSPGWKLVKDPPSLKTNTVDPGF